MTVWRPSTSWATVRVSSPMWVTSPSNTRALACLAGTSRVAGAISPSDSHARGHLVQQRLEEVVSRLGDERHLDVPTLECAGREEPAKARSDDDDAMFLSAGHVRVNRHADHRMPSSPACERVSQAGWNPVRPEPLTAGGGQRIANRGDCGRRGHRHAPGEHDAAGGCGIERDGDDLLRQGLPPEPRDQGDAHAVLTARSGRELHRPVSNARPKSLLVEHVGEPTVADRPLRGTPSPRRPGPAVSGGRKPPASR